MPDKAKCKSCGALLIWAETEAGKRQPLDAEPHLDGTIELDADGTCRVVGKLAATGPLYRSHFASCPQAREHRRKQR